MLSIRSSPPGSSGLRVATQGEAGPRMRISAGALKGKNIGSRKIFSSKNGTDELRPTSAKVREALFDILRNDISGAIFLDLYAGSGAVGFEALSRGAGRVSFVEEDQRRARAIQETINKAGLDKKASVPAMQVIAFLRQAERSGGQFDIIFADPPYATEELNEVMQLIDTTALLREGGTLVIEHASKRPPEDSGLGTLHLLKKYRYGDTMLTRYRKVT